MIDNLPKEPGVYLMRDEKGVVLYVGKAKNLHVRVRQYFLPGRDGRKMVPYLTSKVRKVDTIVTPSEKEALLLENTLIKKHQPQYNVLLKDDKSFICITINHKHPWPRLKIVRTKDQKKDELYFGPYTNAVAARETLDTLASVFPLRQCSDRELGSRKRPCLLYSIKRCIAPCVNKCTRDEYQTHLDGAIRFLKGQDREVIDMLKEEMEKASEALEYERAGFLLKQIRQLERVVKGRKALVQSRIKDCDALSMHREADRCLIVKLLFREGRLIGSKHFFFKDLVQEDEAIWESFLLQHYVEERPKEILLPLKLPLLRSLLPVSHPTKGGKKKLVELAHKNAKLLFVQERDAEEKILLEMEEQLGLSRCPLRIECFDTSSISGGDFVASMVTFSDGVYDKKRRRLFKVKVGSDDYSAMREVLTRRYTKAKEENDLPDLVIVDGGKGQLGVLVEVMRHLDIASCDLMALTKEEARHDKGLTRERIFLPGQKEPICLSPHSPILFLLQKIRDEAHRVALSYHKKVRQKRMTQSLLDQIPGIGPTKKKRLLTHFGSVKQVLAASEEELLAIPGITKKDVQEIVSKKGSP